MNSRRRVLGAGLGVLAAAALLGGLLLLPPVQRRLLLSVAAAPGRTLDVDRVWITPFSISLRGLTYSERGVAAKVGEGTLVPRLGRLLRGQVGLEDVRLSDVELDLSKVPAASTPEGAAAAQAAAPVLMLDDALPAGLELGKIAASGRVLLPGAEGGPAVSGSFSLSGGEIGPARSGHLELKASLSNPVKQAPVSALEVVTRIRLEQSPAGRATKASADSVVTAGGLTLGGENQLRMAATVERAAAAQIVSLRMETVAGAAPAELLAVNASMPAAGGGITGSWRIIADTARIEPYFFGRSLPDFDLVGEGTFRHDEASQSTSLAGRLEGTLARLEALRPDWRLIGPLRLGSEFDVAVDGASCRVNLLRVSLAGPHPVLTAEAVQAATLNLAAGTVQLGEGSGGEILRLRIAGLPVAWIRPFVPGCELSGGMVTGSFSLGNVDGRVSLRTVDPLAVDSLTLVRDGQSLFKALAARTDLEFSMSPEGWEARAMELELRTPAGDRLVGEAALKLARGGQAFTATAKLGAELPTLLQPFGLPGVWRAQGELDLGLADQKLTFRQLQLRVADGANSDLFRLAALHPFALKLPEWRFDTDGKGPDQLVRITLGHISLAALPGIGRFAVPGPTRLAGEVEGGELVVAAEGEHQMLSASKPIRFTGVGYVDENRPMLAGVVAEFSPRLQRDAAGAISFATGPVRLAGPNGEELAGFSADLTREGEALRVNSTFSVELPALGAQPGFKGAEALSAGRVAGEVRSTTDASRRQVEAKVTVNGLALRDSDRALPLANVSLRAEQNSDGSGSVEVPVLLDRVGVRSDLRFSAKLEREGIGHRLSARWEGGNLVVDDLLAIAAVFSATGQAATPPPANGKPAPAAIEAGPAVAPTPDTVAAWSQLLGRVDLDVKAISYGPHWSMTGLAGSLVVDADRITLDRLGAAVGEKGWLDAKGELRFVRGDTPYILQGKFALTEFDAGPFFEAVDPPNPPALEGKFGVDASFQGAGRTVPETFAQTHGNFRLSGRQGVFRGLKKAAGKFSVASKAAELTAALGSLFGSERVAKAADKLAGGAYFADQLAQELGELKYDTLVVEIQRDPGLDVRLGDVSLVAKEVHLTGKGGVTHVAGVPFLEQPLNLEFGLAGKGRMESLMGRAKLLTGTRDELDYARSKYPIIVRGSLGKPDALSFYSELAKSKLLENFLPGN